VTTARGLARAYSAFARGDGELGLLPKTLELLAAPAIPPTRGFFDECMKVEVPFSLGFMKPSAALPFGSEKSFGSPGAGEAHGLRRSGRRRGLRVCHEPDGDQAVRRSA
jgi:hypothetical protein